MKVNLTPNGMQLCKIISSIEKYDTSFSKFQDTLKDAIFCIPDYILMSLEVDDLTNCPNDSPNLYEEVENARMTLISKGWKKKEIKYYNEYRSTLLQLNNLFDKNFIYLIVYRFAKLRDLEQDASQNIVRSVVIRGLIMESIEKKIEFLINNSEQVFLGHSHVKRVNPILTKGIILESIGSILQYYGDLQDTISRGLIPSIMKKEIPDMILTYLELLNPPLENLNLKVQEIVDIKKQIEENMNNIKKIMENKDANENTIHKTENITNYLTRKVQTLELFMFTYKTYCEKKEL